MRTKTLALSAVLSALGTASLVAQTNVYSLNAVGYINVTMPPGFSIITCPLIVGTDPANPTVTNDLNVVLNNSSAPYPYANATVYQFQGGHGYTAVENGYPASYGGGWGNGGADVTLLPGQAVFFFNPNPLTGTPINMSATFVGTVPQGSLTNVLVPGYNLVASIVPVSGDIVTNSISAFAKPSYPASGDYVYSFDPAVSGAFQIGFEPADTFSYGSWFAAGGPNPYVGANSDPVTTAVSQGFFYFNNGQNGVAAAGGFPAGTEYWVENFSVNP